MRIIVSAFLFWYFGSVFPVCAEPEEISTNGCRECHRLSLEEKKSDKGPDLFYAGDKYYKNWLNKFLQSPTGIREVNIFSESDFRSKKHKVSNLHVALAKEGAERVANFLMTLRLPNFEIGTVNKEPLSKGERAQAKILFERSFGCISCHRALNLVGKVRGGVSGPSLVNSGLRLKPDWIFHWLKTPRKFMYEGRMPVFDIDEETIILIAKYIFGIRTNP
jgi:mono/diheme cytochrome c family protein